MAVTVSEIEAAYNALKADGKETTARAVRARLGDRGSFGTINPVVSRLNANNMGTAPIMPTPLSVASIPQPLVDRVTAAVLSLVADITQMANDRCEQRVQEADQRALQAAAAQEAVEEQNRQYEKKIDEQDEQIRELSREISQLKTSLALETQAREKAVEEHQHQKGQAAALEASSRQAADELNNLKPQVERLTTAKEYLEQKATDQGNEIQSLKTELKEARAATDSSMKEALRLTGELATIKAERDALQAQNTSLAQDIANHSQEHDRQRALVDKLLADQAASSDKHAEQLERIGQNHYEMVERLLSEFLADRDYEPAKRQADTNPLNGHDSHPGSATDNVSVGTGATASRASRRSKLQGEGQ